MSIEFEGFYDGKSLYKQTALVEHPSAKFLFRRLAFGLVSGLIIVWLVLGMYYTKQYSARSVWSALILAFFFYIVAIQPFLSPYLAVLQVITKTKRELFRKGEISSNGVHYLVPDLFEPTTPWSKIYRAKKTDDLVILFVDSASPIAFPRSFFKREADWQQFNQWVNHYVKEDD
jgi:YcxB-like protein